MPPPALPETFMQIRPGMGEVPAPAPEEGAWTNTSRDGCNADRVQLAGGMLNALMLHPSILPFEQLYRRLPDEGMFSPTVSPNRPFIGELGAFRVPDTFDLALFDLRPDIYRFSGLDPGDTVPVEARRFSSILGFDLTIDGRHQGNVKFELDPIAFQTVSEAFQTAGIGGLASILAAEGITVDPSRFNITAATSFASAAGAGTALLPQRPRGYGAPSIPFTLYVRAGQAIDIKLVVFRPVPSPIAFIEYDIAGILIPHTWLETMLACLKPLSNASGGPGSLGGGPR